VGYNPYNGYSGKERDEKEAERARLLQSGDLQMRHTACELCGDPDTPTKPHVEDYSKPYLWEPPAEYMVCDTCEHDMLQKRFRNKDRWDSFKAHVRRGGYARDLQDPAINKEFLDYREARERGEKPTLRKLRDRQLTGEEWWEKLSIDSNTLTDPKSRPRP
jgi:hypothetical protein